MLTLCALPRRHACTRTCPDHTHARTTTRPHRCTNAHTHTHTHTHSTRTRKHRHASHTYPTPMLPIHPTTQRHTPTHRYWCMSTSPSFATRPLAYLGQVGPSPQRHPCLYRPHCAMWNQSPIPARPRPNVHVQVMSHGCGARGGETEYM
jgi:hypothetical protein